MKCNKRMITDDMGKPNIVISWSLLAESIHKQRMNISSKTSVQLMSWCLLAERGMSSKNEHVIENMSSIDNEMFPMLQVCSRYPGYISDTPGMSPITRIFFRLYPGNCIRTLTLIRNAYRKTG